MMRACNSGCEHKGALVELGGISTEFVAACDPIGWGMLEDEYLVGVKSLPRLT